MHGRSLEELTEGVDPREVPLYGAKDAARYLKLPASTVAAWSRGTTYGRAEDRGAFTPVIRAAQRSPLRLSFANLVELHVLGSLRRGHQVRLDAIRHALAYVQATFGVERPLVHQVFHTDGADLFVEEYGRLVTASKHGQEAIREVMKLYLRRVDVDERGVAARLFPFTRSEPDEHVPRLVAIDPVVSYGRPFITGRGVPTEVIADRYWAGDSMAVLAVEYRCSHEVIEEALRCESELREAA